MTWVGCDRCSTDGMGDHGPCPDCDGAGGRDMPDQVDCPECGKPLQATMKVYLSDVVLAGGPDGPVVSYRVADATMNDGGAGPGGQAVAEIEVYCADDCDLGARQLHGDVDRGPARVEEGARAGGERLLDGLQAAIRDDPDNRPLVDLWTNSPHDDRRHVRGYLLTAADELVTVLGTDGDAYSHRTDGVLSFDRLAD